MTAWYTLVLDQGGDDQERVYVDDMGESGTKHYWPSDGWDGGPHGKFHHVYVAAQHDSEAYRFWVEQSIACLVAPVPVGAVTVDMQCQHYTNMCVGLYSHDGTLLEDADGNEYFRTLRSAWDAGQRQEKTLTWWLGHYHALAIVQTN